MEIARATESLKASVLCLREGLVNSAASRAYYAMFQAAQIALEAEGLMRSQWSHKGLHSSFNPELIHQRKLYPRIFRDYLTSALTVRQAADCGEDGVSAKITARQVRRAEGFVNLVTEVIKREKRG
ncbi:MAG: HEPN domain-containing protein [Deltaproteobacteria bacterium]|nr:HEPN domain-containing protein [Deltaproteobacteria bacterium]